MNSSAIDKMSHFVDKFDGLAFTIEQMKNEDCRQ